MGRGHPPFLLAGGEIVLLILSLKIGFWILRGWQQIEHSPDPDDPGGLPVPAPIELMREEAPDELPEEELRLAA